MKKILFIFLSLFFIGGLNSVKAEKVYADLSKYDEKWDGEDLNFSWTATYGNQLFPKLDEIGLPNGDLSSWEKLVVVVDELNNCDFFRVLIYNGDNLDHSNTFKCTTTGSNEFTLSGNVDELKKVTKIVLSGSNWEDSKQGTWGETPASFKVKEVYLERPDDPLALPKERLTKAISLGEKQNSFAKTTASWNALQTAISKGGEALVDASATEESLDAATKAITDAIDGFEYQDGYTALTKEMANANVDYVLNSSTGLPYGTGGVDMNVYAELNEFDQFIVLAADGQPRFCMNRKTSNGQIGPDLASSEMIDIPPQGAYAEYTWAADKYQTIDEKKFTLDLKKIAADWNGLAKLNCIKGAYYGKVTVTDLLLYREITVGETGYATFGSASKNAKVNGVKAYAAIYNKETGKVDLTEVTNVPAGKGVVIEGAAGSYAPTFDVAPADIASDLKVSDGTVTGDGSTIYVLAKGGSGIGFYPLKSGNTLEAGKAYLQIGGSARGFIGFEGATGINEVNVNKAAVKTGKIYNLNGQIVSKPSKGLFIVDGKVVSF